MSGTNNYLQVKAWRARHPGYGARKMAEYRANPEFREAERDRERERKLHKRAFIRLIRSTGKIPSERAVKCEMTRMRPR